MNLYDMLFRFIQQDTKITVSADFGGMSLYNGTVIDLLEARVPALVSLYNRIVRCITVNNNKLYILIGD